MKIEIGESFCYSYLRHVKKCLLVQTNWKSSKNWEKHLSDQELNGMFQDMKKSFGDDVFKKSTPEQLLKQGEIDVVGMDAQNNIYALEIAFHESGLDAIYLGRVLKKLLRTYLLMQCYFPNKKVIIGFVSPKVNPAQMRELKEIFDKLKTEYPQVQWDLWANDTFSRMCEDTLSEAEKIADSSELFMRAIKLRNLARTEHTPKHTEHTPHSGNDRPLLPASVWFQPMVQKLMTVLLQTYPLSDDRIEKMMDVGYCQNELKLQISYPVVKLSSGEKMDRYWKKSWGKYCVCSEWAKKHHCDNARSLIRFLESLRNEFANHARNEKLQDIENELRENIKKFCNR